MNKLTKEELIKLAEKWGGKYSLNSDTPGIFINNGQSRREFTLEDLLDEAPDECDYDSVISRALGNIELRELKMININMTSFSLKEDFSGVA